MVLIRYLRTIGKEIVRCIQDHNWFIHGTERKRQGQKESAMYLNTGQIFFKQTKNIYPEMGKKKETQDSSRTNVNAEVPTYRRQSPHKSYPWHSPRCYLYHLNNDALLQVSDYQALYRT